MKVLLGRFLISMAFLSVQRETKSKGFSPGKQGEKILISNKLQYFSLLYLGAYLFIDCSDQWVMSVLKNVSWKWICGE